MRCCNQNQALQKCSKKEHPEFAELVFRLNYVRKIIGTFQIVEIWLFEDPNYWRSRVRGGKVKRQTSTGAGLNQSTLFLGTAWVLAVLAKEANQDSLLHSGHWLVDWKDFFAIGKEGRRVDKQEMPGCCRQNFSLSVLQAPAFSTVCLGSTNKLCLCWKLKHVNLLEMT